MPAFDYEQIPGYVAAVQKETLIRNACFLPINETIEGFEVKPMTVRDYVTLRTINSPLLSGVTPSKNDVIAFLWLLSPKFNPIGGREKRRLMKPFKTMSIDQGAKLVVGIRKYIEETFQDRPSSSGSGDKVFVKSYYADVCHMCATFAKHFGWDDELTLGKPVKRIFQYLKVLREQGGQKVAHFNPSDAIAMRYIAEQERKEATQ